MKKCQKCGGTRLALISAKCSDLCCVDLPSEGIRVEGYAPCIPGVTGDDEDYIVFTVCLGCGQLQGKFPVESPASKEG